jgi:hypothetical protein
LLQRLLIECQLNGHSRRQGRSSGDAGDLAVVVDDAESPLAWLASRKGPDGRPLLSQQMFDAGERLRRDFEAGQMSDRVTAQWGASIMPGARGRSGLPGQTLTAVKGHWRRANGSGRLCSMRDRDCRLCCWRSAACRAGLKQRSGI